MHTYIHIHIQILYTHIYTHTHVLYSILLYSFLHIFPPQKVLTCYDKVIEISEIKVPRYGQSFLIVFV